jgi:hypothetical protein
MLLHSDTLFWFRINFIVFSLTQPGLEPTIYHTQGEHANIMPPMYVIIGGRWYTVYQKKKMSFLKLITY